MIAIVGWLVWDEVNVQVNTGESFQFGRQSISSARGSKGQIMSRILILGHKCPETIFP